MKGGTQNGILPNDVKDILRTEYTITVIFAFELSYYSTQISIIHAMTILCLFL